MTSGYFDLVQDICIDALHLLHGGITKKTWLRMFQAPGFPFPKGITKHQVELEFSSMFTLMKLPTEYRHKTRSPMDYAAQMKGSEWQAMDLFAFVPMALTLPQDEGHIALQRILLAYSFIVRALYIGDSAFAKVKSQVNLKRLVTELSSRYARVFGKNCLSFNFHSLYHAFEYRDKKGPLWQHSTARYESMYTKVRQYYQGNTLNGPKQVLGRIHASNLRLHHCTLQTTLHFNSQPTEKTDDSLVVYRGKFYQVVLKECANVTLQKLGTEELDTEDIVPLPWSLVGVRSLSPFPDGAPFKVKAAVIREKAVACHGVISSIKPQWIIT